jgi:hypothetical protein
MATAPEPEAPEGEKPRTDLDEVHERALRRFDDTVTPQLEQRAQSLAARRFATIPGAQWEGEWGDAFDNTIKIESNKVAAGLEKITRDYRENRIVPDFRPAGGDSDPDTANTLDGLHRADSYHFKAQQARDNAFDEASAGGFGAYRLSNEWEDPYDKDNDRQRINPGLTIVDADQRVFFDPNSKLYDKSDARWAFVLTAKTKEAFEADHDGKCSSWPDPKQPGHSFEWFAPEVVIVAEYYEVVEKDEKLWILSHRVSNDEQRFWSSDIDADELADLEAMGWVKRAQRKKRIRVRKFVLSGHEVLDDCGFIAGSCIPIVPVYGKRWYIDNLERFRGYVQLKMDDQRIYNGRLSKLAEIDALAPREIPIFAREQMPSTLAEMWARQNVDRHAYALVEPLRDDSGQIVSAGPIGKVEPPQVPQVTALLLQAALQGLTEDMAEVDEVKANTSAEAMDIAATRIDAKSAIYLDHMRQSVQREGEIYLSMAADVYWEPERVVETMSEDGEDGEAKLHEPVSDDRGNFRIRNDFTKGRYKVIADVTEATATRRDKTVKAMVNIGSQLAPLDPKTAAAAFGVAVLNMDGEGLTDFQTYMRKQLVASGVIEPNDDEREQLEQAAQNAAPDPTEAALMAQAKELETQAEVNVADAKLKDAKTLETLAKARQASQPQMPQPANDMARPRIRMGRDL